MSRACKSPAKRREAGPTPAAAQQLLPLVERIQPTQPTIPSATSKPLGLKPTAVPRLWFCIYLPDLPLEACRRTDEALAIVEEQHGIHRVLQANTAAQKLGIALGQSANAALALLPTLSIEERSQVREQQVLQHLATWLEQFSSFVSIAAEDVLLLEIAGSLRLFGGLQALRETVSHGLREKGFSAALAIAPTPLAATWLARAGRRSCIRAEENLAPMLRKLPLQSLNWAEAIRESLIGMGVKNVGDCLRLPREGFTRRFGAECLLELDRALGHLPDPRDSWRAPERFCADYEMTEEQSDRELLLNVCHELLLSHEQFLLARQLGTQRLCFNFFHLKSVATELYLGSAYADRSTVRWFELLKIRFEQLRLPEAVIAVRLRSGLSQTLQATTEELCFNEKPGKRQRRYSVAQLVERLIARNGDHGVNSMVTVAEHRPEYACREQNPLLRWAHSSSLIKQAGIKQAGIKQAGITRAGQERPLWMLPEPALLSVEEGYPVHNGSQVTLLEGPERLETGWWDDEGVSRDYYTAVSSAGIRLWVFRHRKHCRERPAWYLHGVFG